MPAQLRCWCKRCIHAVVCTCVLAVLMLTLSSADLASLQGKTALHYATRKCRLDIMELLLSNGADVSPTSVDENVVSNCMLLGTA